MSMKNLYTTTLATLAAAVFLGAGSANADTLTLVTSQSAQQATDSIGWASVGGDQAPINASGTVKTAKGASVLVSLAAANSVLSRVCSASPCSWTGAGFPAGDTLLWTSDAGNGGNGPVKLTFSPGIAGAGAAVQSDGPGKFTASIQAFNGSTLLGTFSVASATTGAPVYIGVLDQTGPNITSVVFSLTAVTQGLTSDFAVDTVQLTPTLAAPTVSFTPASLSFGNVPVGTTSAAKTVTMKNTGTVAMKITSIASTGDYKQTNNCVTPLNAGASCVITVTLHPTAAGTRTGAIVVTDNAKGSPQSVGLTGAGTVPVVQFTPASLSFPAQLLKTKSAVKTITVHNAGAAPLNIASIVATGDFTQTNNCGTALAPNANCTLSVIFTPTAAGTRGGTISVTDNAAGSPQKVTLTGIGTEAKLSTTKLTFAATTVGKVSASQTVTLTNVGSTAMGVSSISLTGTNPGDFSKTTTCGASVAAGASCTVSVVFQPKATGARSANLSIADNGGASPQLVALTGTGQ